MWKKIAASLGFVLAVSAAVSAGGVNPPIIWQGIFARTFPANLSLNNTAYLLQGSADPTSSAQNAPQGSIYLRTGASGGNIYTKQDAGSSTNWNAVSTGAATSIGSFNGTSTANGLDLTGGAISLHAADGTNPGAISTTTQTISGAKTLTSDLSVGVSGTGTARSISIRSGTTGTGQSVTFVNAASSGKYNFLIGNNFNNANIFEITPSTATDGGTYSTAAMKISAVDNSVTIPGQLISTLADGTAPFVVASATRVANLNATLAGSATNATNVATTSTNSTNATFFPTFVASSSSSNQGIDTASGFNFNPSTGTVTATTFAGALSGNASTATTATNQSGGTVSATTGAFSGQLTDSAAGAASTSAVKVTGAPFTGGSATTTTPLVLLENASTSNAWSTSGTELGINPASGFTGNLIDAQINAISQFSVGSAGNISVTGLGGGSSKHAFEFIYTGSSKSGICADSGQAALCDGNNAMFLWNGSSVTANTILKVAPAGSVGAVSLQMNSQATTGLWSPASTSIGFSSNGVNQMTVSTSGLAVTNINDNGTFLDSVAGASSTPAVRVTGAPYAAGTATSNKPQVMIEDAGTSNAWSTGGTYLGVNAASGFAGNLFDAQLNAVSKFLIASDGSLTDSKYGAGIATFSSAGLVSSTSTTGSGNVMLAASPSTTGTLTAAAINASGTVAVTSTTGSGLTFKHAADDSTQFVLGNNTGSSEIDGVIRLIAGGAMQMYSDTGKSLALGTNGSSMRLTIDSAGLVTLASTTDSTAANTGSFSTPGGIAVAKSIYATGLSTGTNADTVCLASDGKVLIQAAACTISKRALKEYIESLRGEEALKVIMALNPVEFNFRHLGPENSDPNYYHRQAGFIAEEVAAVDPSLAVYEPDMKTPKSYRQEAIISKLVRAVQTQQHEIEHLKSQCVRK